jgi:7-cyano-7-deazaguanine synthase
MKAIVNHSGGMDSSICLALAIKEFGKDQVLSLSFNYGQTHSPELIQAAKICREWDVKHVILSVECFRQITDNALINSALQIIHERGQPPNTLVVGRNGLMARLAAILAHYLGSHQIFMGVIEVEHSSSGYRDCSRRYMDLMQEILRIDLDDAAFQIRTPIVHMTKCETMHLANELGILNFLLLETISCYKGIKHQGCEKCPACFLRNQGIEEFGRNVPEFILPYRQ